MSNELTRDRLRDVESYRVYMAAALEGTSYQVQEIDLMLKRADKIARAAVKKEREFLKGD